MREVTLIVIIILIILILILILIKRSFLSDHRCFQIGGATTDNREISERANGSVREGGSMISVSHGPPFSEYCLGGTFYFKSFPKWLIVT